MTDPERALPAATKLRWMPFYGGDFFGDEAVAEMSNEEVGATLRLLWHQWSNGSIPAERPRLERIAGTRQLAAILPLFPICEDQPGRRAHPAVAELYAEQQLRHSLLSEAGRKGGRGRASSLAQAEGLEPGLKPGPSIREEKRREERTSRQTVPPALAESRATLERELATFSPSVLEAIVLWADRSANPASVWAAVRRYGPGGASEFPGVIWADVAVGIDEAATLGRELTPNKVGACIRSAIDRRTSPTPRGASSGAGTRATFQGGLDAIAEGKAP